MQFESKETVGNGPEKNFVECPYCEQKLLNVVSLEGLTVVTVKCRRCHKFIRVRMEP